MGDWERESYVALFDILGFAHKVSSKPIEDMIEELDYLEKRAQTDHVKSIVFSDTVLLYTEGIEPNKLRSLLDHCMTLVSDSNAKGIMLRGAIARGEFYHQNQTFLGKAMVRAYHLEQSQDWMGAILDPFLANDLSKSEDEDERQVWHAVLDDGVLVPYRAPIKDGPVGEQWCLGWPQRGDKQRVPSRNADWNVLRKFANTDDFARNWNKGGK